MLVKLLKLFLKKIICNVTQEEQHDEVFIIDFIDTRESNETLKNAKVVFPANSEDIIINGERKYFDAFFLRNGGLSRDNLYFRVSTRDFEFWVRTWDYKRFMSIVNYRRRKQIEIQKNRYEIANASVNIPFEYDPIDQDIYKCFISDKSGLRDGIGGTLGQFNKLEQQIAKICAENNGRYFRTPAKNAKFAIIFSYTARTYSNVTKLREMGYKVTNFEKALEFFELKHMWNIEALKNKENEYKKLLREKYKQYKKMLKQ